MKISYFAWLKDKLGCEEEEITLPADVTNVGQLINWLSRRGPKGCESDLRHERSTR